ncbi:hypothetical protein [Providencia rettgeri]|uniref:hypothetical protein n=1 Tax=Providencia rettgeri TaxID=587 RepID=UPI001B368369|nr:hypothetical protein [Providencia rettgeri]MBQ0372958.1 hypothetical protein [Providencia rettgeri]
MFEPNVYDAIMKEFIRWYRDLDFSEMREDARDEILDIYVDNGKPLIEGAKYQIAINVHFIAMAYDDVEMQLLEEEIMNAETKNAAKEILNKISERLKEPRYSGAPSKMPSPPNL